LYRRQARVQLLRTHGVAFAVVFDLRRRPDIGGIGSSFILDAVLRRFLSWEEGFLGFQSSSTQRIASTISGVATQSACCSL